LNRDTLNHVNPKSVVRNPKIKPFVENVVSRCLDCGDLAEGFARICCENCKNSMLLPFSSKGRCSVGPATRRPCPREKQPSNDARKLTLIPLVQLVARRFNVSFCSY